MSSIVADYRPSAGIDLEHDTVDRAAGRQLTMPVTVIRQDWGAALGFDAQAIWRSCAPDLEHRTTSAGHFMAEAAPGAIAIFRLDVAQASSARTLPSALAGTVRSMNLP